MKVIGITGGIATGKSAVAAIFEDLGAPVFNADVCVHRLLDHNADLYAQISWTFPKAIIDRKIDRKLLGDAVFADETRLTKLETILHPYVRQEEVAFIKRALQDGKKAAILDVPLLLETDADKLCDAVIVTECDELIQLQRAMERPYMTEEKFRSILRRQMKPQERRKKATHIIKTDGTIEQTRAQVQDIIKELGI